MREIEKAKQRQEKRIPDTKTKISLTQVKKFAASITKVKDENKIKDISTIYISEAGFSKTAKAYLKKKNITFPHQKTFLSNHWI